MKSVLISIQPYWVFLIIAKTMGWKIDKEKTIEVRKSFPKAEDWNRQVEIYCSKDKKSFNLIPKEYQPLMQKFLGKVVGKWFCDKIADIKPFGLDIEEFEKQSCLSALEIARYLKGLYGYAWHISNFKIYDKPKELSEFLSCKKCVGKKYNYCGSCKGSSITRPPQSWCYVESQGE